MRPRLRCVAAIRSSKRLLVNLFGRLDEFRQANESFPGLLNSTREYNEMQAGFHDVLGASVSCNNVSWFPSPDNFLESLRLSVALDGGDVLSVDIQSLGLQLLSNF